MAEHARRFRSRRTFRIAIVIACLFPSGIAAADGEWTPQRPLRLIVPYDPGGTADSLARMIAPPLGDALGQAIVVENRGGANGVIGTEAVARAIPDGYTLGLVSLSAHAGVATLNKKLPYDSVKDFAPITFVARSPLVLVVGPSNAAQSVADLMARAHAARRPIFFATAGFGISTHIAGELLKLAAVRQEVEMVVVPFKGGGPAMVAVMSGQVDMQFNPLSSILPFVSNGKLRPLAIADRQRSTLLPSVPTMAESAYPDFYIIESWGLLAPVGTPPDIVRRLATATVKVLEQPDRVRRLASQGVDLAPSTPQQLTAFMEAEIDRYRDVIQRAGITTE